MKRFVLLLSILLLTGCISVNESDYTSLINESINSKVKIYNTYRNGYKFYLPKGLEVDDKTEYNEVIKSGKNTYYLFIDLISYLHQKENSYILNNEAFYSSLINNNEKNGYIEINEKNNKYLVEIMYNYAKIEVMVGEEDLRKAITNATIVLASIYYNDDYLHNLSEENVLSYSEQSVEIFNTKGIEDDNFLTYDPSIYDEDDTEIPDYDLIK